MKKIILFFIFFLCAKSFAQTNGITYQALILNPTEGKVSTATNTNSPLVSKDICMLFKFVDEFSNVEYQEVIRTKTDPYGMVNLIIGTGTQTAGYSTSFDKISWDSVQKNLVVGISFTGDCSSFTEISNQPFSSVPFAYSSINAVNVTGVVALENGGTNATTVVGAKTNLGLENVDNTTDLNKPISTASKLALNLKEDTINKSTNVTTDGNSDIKYPTVKSVKNYVDSSVSFNLLGLTNEISRATLAENTIAANLVSETERATLAEATIATAITAETNRATLAENTLTTNLTAEVNRATTAEATKEDAANKSTDGSFASNSDVKFPTEKATKTYVDATASSNSLALTNEISRATLAENIIAANLVTETERATLAEAKNATAINAEINRANLAETTLKTNLTAEVNRATTAEATKEDAANKSTDGSFTSNSDVKFPTEKATKTYVDATASSNSLALTNEISRATLAENTNAANLVTETERATLAETNNATAITSETTRATLAETTLTTNVAAEVNRATSAEATKEDTINKSTDGSFASNSDVKFPTEKATKTYVDATASSSSLALTNEISRATTAENTFAANLVSETERATLAEATNATAITAETNRATLAENTLTTNLTAEVNRATTAEATKEDAANKSTDGSFASNSDVKFPTEKATKTYVDATASSNSLALTNEISRATLAENTIAANLVSETERATLAEANNAITITAETNRATLAETTLTTNLTAEVNRATSAEATKEDASNKSTDGSFASNSDLKFPTEKATKTYVDASTSSNSLALTNEISRATLAENTIAANLVSEIERATLAEATLTTNLTAEVNRATTAEATKEDAANKSTDGSFTSNSDVKFPTEKATKTYVDATASSNSLALTNEISRATLAENIIAANLVSETERATLAESTNATAINAEINRANLAETTLKTNLTAEVNRATTAEATKEDAANKSTDGSFTSNSDVKFPTEKATKTYVDASASSNYLSLTNEISRATTSENAIAVNLVSETERATLAESTLTTNLTAEVNRATTAEATKEDTVNKSTDGSFTSNSDVKFPTEKAIKTYVDASALSSSLALNNEISRATTAENNIVANLVSETERATLAETNNATAISSETNRATLVEATLTTNLTAEVSRSTAAEATKEDAINKSTDGSFASNSDMKFPTEKATKTYVDASASSNSLALTNEISRATLAENTIAANLVTETERATLAETNNATSITAETNRATTAEATKEGAANKSTDGSFASNSDVKFPTEKATKTYVDASASSNSLALTNEITRATTAENAIAANLISETERATLAEATLTTNLTAETNRATTAEATKEDAVNKSTDGSFNSNSDVKFPTEKATKTYVDASASSNSLALTNEISRATLAENTIAANLVLETERATLAEATNAIAINAETNRATLAETTNSTAITAETNRATLAEATLKTNLTVEVNRATAAEATKEDAVNKSTDGNFTSNSDVKFPTEKATKTYVDATASSNSLALTNEISRATLAENTIAANLVSENERATLAEATNATAITAETNRATLAETTLSTNLTAEVNRATTAEATKEDAANKSTDGSFTSNSDVKFPTEKATKTYVDATASSNSLALTNEISRATLAENIIAANLVSETERATLAESTNATAITTEVNRATLVETTLATNLNTEVNRATAVEATKEDAVNKSTDGSFATNSDVKFPTEKATKTYVDASASSNSLALTNEISRATLAENAIAANLVTETERATLAEATKEDAANKSTDGSFTSNSDVKFPTEKATKTYVDASASSNSLALTNEISRATKAENTIAANLVSENERATLAEATNATAINAETNRATLAETTNATAITAETNRATLAEATLTTNLTAEVNRATVAEATKEDAVNKSTDGSFTSNSDVKFPTEKATKTYVDASASSNSLALNNEISRATLAETALATNLTAEVNRATAAEATKEDAANKSTDGSFASNSDVKFPTEKATKTYVDASASSNSLALSNEISRATTAENAIAANLVTETERATLAETNNATSITAETNRATLAENTLSTNLTTETNRATTAEATKEDSANKSTDGSFASNSDVKFPTEKATKTYVDASASSNSVALTNEISRATLAETTNATAITTEVNRATVAEATKEDAGNKSTDGSFTSNSDVKFPTEKATKTYVDASSSSNSLALTNEISRATLAENAIAANLVTETERATLAETSNATAITSEITRATLEENTLTTNLTAEVNRATTAEATKEDAANKSTDGSFTSNSDVKFPTEKATKTYVDASTSSNSSSLATEVTDRTNADLLKEDKSNKSVSLTTDGASDTKYPSVKSVKDYVDGEINTSETDTQTALNLKANVASPTFTGTVSGIDKTMVGLSNVDDTTDANKPVSIATQTALDLKANLVSPTLTGIPTAPTADSGTNTNQLATTAFVTAVASSSNFVDLTTDQTVAGTKTFSSTVTGNSFVKSGGTSAQYLMADGSVSNGTAPVREEADEFSAMASQTSFTLTQTPSVNSKVRMYVNGIRISKTAYSVSGTTLTYIPANNGSYSLSVNDRIQFDYFY
ncbi:hypothetical protein FQU23_013015 [Flavobacterium sp. XN-5]|uniref:beta strand repeat-containing protein n=1 Tax=Flavobacterium sp. XN-5 TaxID=2599390 RepID=UPI0011C8A95F|nr:hypothetical protein [Flavobacterium sp. XN-5]NGY38429.1 hypothetical protein [Flavobacterium sp. XN-5]